MNRRNQLGLVLLVLALAGFLWWLGKPRDPATPLATAPNRPDFYFKFATAYQFNADGSLKNTAYADELLHYELNDTLRYKAPEIRFYRDPNAPWIITAKNGHATEGGQTVFLNGTVIAKRIPMDSGREVTVTTEDVTLIPDKNLARTDKHTIIHSGNTTTTGVGAELNDAKQTLRLLNNVTTHYDPTTH